MSKAATKSPKVQSAAPAGLTITDPRTRRWVQGLWRIVTLAYIDPRYASYAGPPVATAWMHLRRLAADRKVSVEDLVAACKPKRARRMSEAWRQGPK